MLALLSLAVAAAIFMAAAVDNMAPAPGNAEFGTVNHHLRFHVTDARSLEADIAFALDQFGTVDVIGHRYVAIPGSVERLELRSQSLMVLSADRCWRSWQAAIQEMQARLL